jgi:protein gp37
VASVFGVMAIAQQHQFLILTKRPERMRALLTQSKQDYGPVAGMPAFQMATILAAGRIARERFPKKRLDVSIEWPLPNVWLGTSVENQRWANERVPQLLDTPAAVRFLSCEPLLGPVDLTRCWTGDESYVDGFRGQEVFTPQHVAIRPRETGKLGWVIAGGESGPVHRPLDLAWARSLRDQCVAAGVPYFLKQLGGRRAGGQALLDGREWRQYPNV